MTLHDHDLRTALHAQLAQQDSGFVVDELGLCGQVRVDVATVSDLLAGYELKSTSDTLSRLPNQVQWYSKCLDTCTLVVAENHHDAALEIIPDWWGCTIARDGVDTTWLDPLRPGLINEDLDPFCLAQLLWKPEVTRALEQRDALRGYRSKPRWILWQRLTEITDVDDIRGLVRQSLRSRPTWRKPTGPPRRNRSASTVGHGV